MAAPQSEATSIGPGRDHRLRWSKFAHILKRDGAIVCYHSLNLATVTAPAAAGRDIERIDGLTESEILDQVALDSRSDMVGFLDELREEALLVPVAYDEGSYLGTIRQTLFEGRDGHIHDMYLNVVGNCNLGCTYCYVDGGKVAGYDKVKMTPEIAYKAIDKYADEIKHAGYLEREPSFDREQSQGAPAVVFYGGEPLINWEVVLSTLEYIEWLQAKGALPIWLEKVLITNGTLVRPAIAEALARHKVSVSLSIDGPEEVHDRHRVTLGGKGSHDKVLAGLAMLREAGVQPTIAAVISPQAVEKLPEIIRYFVEELDVKAVGMNHVSILPDNGFGYDRGYEAEFTEAILKGQELILSYGDVFDRRMSNKLNSFLRRRLTSAECAAANGGQFAVGPTGEVMVCQGDVGKPGKHRVGTVFEDEVTIRESEAVREWATRSPLNMESCEGCISLGSCGGGCPHNAESLHGSIWELDTPYCQFSRRATEWMVWKVFDAERGSDGDGREWALAGAERFHPRRDLDT